jgi:hypothetical protein
MNSIAQFIGICRYLKLGAVIKDRECKVQETIMEVLTFDCP